MKIWILEIGEPLPLEGDVRLHRYGRFSRYLAEQGHSVTWWTSSFSHAPKRHFVDADEDRDYLGVTLRLIRGLGYPRNVSFARIKHNRHFARRFSELAPLIDAPDLIIAPIPIIEAATAAIEYAKPRGIPVITDIRDEWPEELKNLAPAPVRPLARLLLSRSYRAMTKFCQSVVGLMGVSERQINYGLRFAGRPRTENDILFPHGYSAEQPSPNSLAKAEDWYRTLELREEVLTLCFFGTLGKYFDFETVFSAIRDLNSEFPVQLVVGGTGSSLDRYKSMAAGLEGVRFPGWLDAPKINVVMKHSQVGLAPYISGSAMSLPNKPFEYMSAKLPILSSIQGELRELVAHNRCGITYLSDDKGALMGALRFLNKERTEAKAMGQRGHELWAKEFTTEAIFARIERHLAQIVTK